jgi:IS5 family transposase
MTEQRTCADAILSNKRRTTRRERFLTEMDQVIPWATVEATRPTTRCRGSSAAAGTVSTGVASGPITRTRSTVQPFTLGMLANLFRVRHRWLPQGTSCRRARRQRPIRADPAPDPGHHEACTGIPTRRSRVLQWPGVEVGRSDMRVAASGDRADMAMQLAERFHRAPGLTARLRASIPARAPNAQAARDFVRVLLSPAGVDSGLSGQSALQRHGR